MRHRVVHRIGLLDKGIEMSSKMQELMDLLDSLTINAMAFQAGLTDQKEVERLREVINSRLKELAAE